MATPESSIDWKRRFALPLAVPLNEGQLPAGRFLDYFGQCRILPRLAAYPNPAFNPDSPRKLRQAGAGARGHLLPRTSRAKDGAAVAAVDIDPGVIRNALRTTQFQGDLPDDLEQAIAAESERVQVVFEDYRSELAPLPFIPEQALLVGFGIPAAPAAPLLAATVDGVAPAVGAGLAFPANPAYLLASGPGLPGELDPLWLRAMLPGLVRFQRYRQLRRSGGNVQGSHPGTSGRLVLWDPDPAHLIEDGSTENRIARSLTGIAYEHVDGDYRFSAPAIGLTMDPGQIARKPAIAECYGNLLIFYLSHYARLRAVQSDPAMATPATAMAPLSFEMVTRILARLLRTWVAYTAHILRPAWSPAFADAGLLAALASDAPLSQDAIEDIARFVTTDLAHWRKLSDFLDAIFVPLYLGASWRSLGVPANRMPARNTGVGWWRQHPWAWQALNGMELAAQNWLVVYGGCPIGKPAGFFRAAQIENPAAADDAQRLEQGEGLTAHEVETLALAGVAQGALGLPAAPAVPASVAAPVDLGPFAAQALGSFAAIRAYRVDVAADASIALQPVPMPDLLGGLLRGIDGRLPVIEIGAAFAGHPLVAANLAAIGGNFAIRSLRVDGQQDNRTLGDAIEYRARHAALVGGTPAELARLQLKVTLAAADGTLRPYLHLRGAAVAADPAFQLAPTVTAVARELPSGWSPDDGIETFLALHALDYEDFMLALHDRERNETLLCVWHRAVSRDDGKSGDQSVRIELMGDALTLASGTAAAPLKLPAAAPAPQIYPALFQHRVATGFGLPPNANLQSRAPGDRLAVRLAYLNLQRVTRAEEGLGLLANYRARAGSDPLRAALDTAWRAAVGTAGDLRPDAQGQPRGGYDSMFFKLLEVEDKPGFTQGILPEAVSAAFHQRIRIVHRAYADYSAELAARGLAALQAPVEAMWALYRIEGALNVPPAFEMLQRGIPPLQRPPQKIIVFPRPTDIGGGIVVDLGELMIGDLIARDENPLVAAGVLGPGLALFAHVAPAAGKPTIDRVRQWCLPMYHINLLALDIYVEPNLIPFNEANSRHAFVKTYLLTRKALGIAVTEDLARDAFAAWYRMAGLLVSCHQGVSFVVARDAVELTAFWLREAMMHFTMLRRRTALTGHVLAHPLPLRLAYLRFNFGDVSMWRVVNIVAMRAHAAMTGAPPLPLAGLAPAVRSFLERVRDDLETALTAPILARLRALSNLTQPLPGDLGRRQADTRAAVAEFRAVEERLLARTAPTAAELAALDGVLPGLRENDLLNDANVATGDRFSDIDALLAWLDGNSLWEGLDGFLASRELDDLLSAFISLPDSAAWRRDNLWQFVNARRFAHYVDGYGRIFA